MCSLVSPTTLTLLKETLIFSKAAIFTFPATPPKLSNAETLFKHLTLRLLTTDFSIGVFMTSWLSSIAPAKPPMLSEFSL